MLDMWPSEKIGANGQNFCVSLFLLYNFTTAETENIEVGSKKKQLASIES